MIFKLIYPAIFLPAITISMVVSQIQIENTLGSSLKEWRHHLLIVWGFATFYLIQIFCIANVTVFTLNIIAYIYVIPVIMVLRNRYHIWWLLMLLTPLVSASIYINLNRYPLASLAASLLQIVLVILMCWILIKCKHMSYRNKVTIAIYGDAFIHFLRLYIENALTTPFVIAVLLGSTITIIAEHQRYHFERKHNEELAKLHYESKRDELTGLLNFRAFDQEMKTLSHQTGINNTYVGAIDVDHFKKVNDTYGHLIGNVVLRTFSKKIRYDLYKNFVPYCSIYRFGGDEFTIVVSNANSEKLAEVLNNVEEHFRKNPIEIPNNKDTVNFSFSCGFTKRLPNEELYHTLERADTLVYKAKNSGRGKILTDQPIAQSTNYPFVIHYNEIENN